MNAFDRGYADTMEKVAFILGYREAMEKVAGQRRVARIADALFKKLFTGKDIEGLAESFQRATAKTNSRMNRYHGRTGAGLKAYLKRIPRVFRGFEGTTTGPLENRLYLNDNHRAIDFIRDVARASTKGSRRQPKVLDRYWDEIMSVT